MFEPLYTFFLHLLLLLWLPVLLYQRVVHGKYKTSWRQKLGMGLPRIDKKGRFLIWVHAPSVGEVRAIAPLVRLMQRDRPDAYILISTTTETGQEVARRTIQAEAYCILPLDLPYIIRPFVARVQPDLLALTETDFWYHFMNAAKENGAQVAVVNGKTSERSLKRYRFLPWFCAPLFQLLDLVCPQNEDYKERFLALGIPPDHLCVTGNLKLDDTFVELSAEEEAEWRKQLGVNAQEPFLVVGSTHEPEERWILAAVEKLWEKWPFVKVAFVPRHTERCKAIAAFLERKKIPFARYSLGESFGPNCPVMLVDAMGVLRQLYQLCTLAVVGGSYTSKVGGHNLLEPSWYGKPVLFGPYTYTQTEMAHMLIQSGGGKRVPLAALAEELSHLLNYPKERQRMGEAGKRIFAESRGATEYTWKQLCYLIRLRKTPSVG